MFNRRQFLGLSGASFLATATATGRAPREVPPQAFHEARFWDATAEGVRCALCPSRCLVREGEIGHCRSRRNTGGRLEALGYGKVTAHLVSPLQRKPIYHTRPDVLAYSFAAAGCNFTCHNCRNFAVSQAGPLDNRNQNLTPRDIVQSALGENCRVVAYTFSEPTVWYEFMYDTAVLARRAGLKNLLVTNGSINEAPLKALLPLIDMVNVDVKSFDDRVYTELTGGRLQPVLDTVRILHGSGVWFEVNNLVIPSWTDDLALIERLCEWLVGTVGSDVPLHFSRFLPRYQLAQSPATPIATLVEARRVARATGIHHVYIHNAEDVDNDTTCPSCGAVLIQRTGSITRARSLTGDTCTRCALPVPGFWHV